jgi:hypothetical protein
MSPLDVLGGMSAESADNRRPIYRPASQRSSCREPLLSVARLFRIFESAIGVSQ